MTKKVGIYEIGKTIGEGSFGLVRLATNTKTKETVAMKIIEKEKIKREDLLHHLKKEVQFLMMIDHPNITKLIEVLASKTKIYLVLEYISGGELWDCVKTKGKLDEDLARRYFRQIIRAIEYCKHKNIAHRDLKPENILMDEKGDLKVSDFGLSELCKDHSNFTQLLHTTCGTLNYLAPEVIQNVGYDGHLADLWSCGVILYFLLSGGNTGVMASLTIFSAKTIELPFEDNSVPSLLEKIVSANYTCPKTFSKSAKDLLTGVLNPNPKKRFTLENIKKHPWFLEKITPTELAGFEEDQKKLLAEKQNQASTQSNGGAAGYLESFESNAVEEVTVEKVAPLTISVPIYIVNAAGEIQVVTNNFQNYPVIPRKMNAFELANYFSGVLINRIFDIEIVKNQEESKIQSPTRKKNQKTSSGEILENFVTVKSLAEVVDTVKKAFEKVRPIQLHRLEPSTGFKLKGTFQQGKEQVTIFGEVFDINCGIFLIHCSKGEQGSLKSYLKLYEEIFPMLAPLVSKS